jgi:hypothetical protein
MQKVAKHASPQREPSSGRGNQERDRWFESGSLQRRVCCEPGISRSGCPNLEGSPSETPPRPGAWPRSASCHRLGRPPGVGGVTSRATGCRLPPVTIACLSCNPRSMAFSPCRSDRDFVAALLIVLSEGPGARVAIRRTMYGTRLHASGRAAAARARYMGRTPSHPKATVAGPPA